MRCDKSGSVLSFLVVSLLVVLYLSTWVPFNPCRTVDAFALLQCPFPRVGWYLSFSGRWKLGGAGLRLMIPVLEETLSLRLALLEILIPLFRKEETKVRPGKAAELAGASPACKGVANHAVANIG